MRAPGIFLPYTFEGHRPSQSAEGRPTPIESPEGRGAGGINGSAPARPTDPAAGKTRHLVLLPTLNEEDGLEATLREFGRVAFRSPQSAPSVLVVDGNSTDGTRAVADRWNVPVLTQRSRGKGAAIREGLAWAAEHGYDAVAVMDADATYPGGSLPALFDLLDLGRDLVVGVRRRETSTLRTVRDLIHRVGNGLLNFTAAQFTRQPLLDVCSGFWGVRTEVLPALGLESNGFDIEAELFVKAFKSKCSVAQFPVTYRKRVGTAKLHAVRDGARILLSILRHSLRPIPATAAAGPGGGTETRPLLNAVLLGLAPEHVVLMSSPDRSAETAAVARRLTVAAPQASVVRATLPSRPSTPALTTLLPGLTEPVSGLGSTVVVALPERERFTSDPSPLWLGIPRTGRIVCLRARPGGDRAPPLAAPATPPPFHRERLPDWPFAALYILCASLEPTWSRRELVLLGANAAGFPIEVARQEPPAVRRPPRPRALGAHRPSSLRRLVGG